MQEKPTTWNTERRKRQQYGILNTLQGKHFRQGLVRQKQVAAESKEATRLGSHAPWAGKTSLHYRVT